MLTQLPLSHLQQTFGRLALWHNIKPPDATKSQSGTGIAGISVQNITCLRGDGGGFKDARSGLLGERRRMELTVRGYGPLVL